MASEESVTLQISQKLSIYGLHFPTESNQYILDQLLKVLLQENSKISVTTKLNAAAFLELEATHLVTNIADVELVYSTFKNVFQGSSGDNSGLVAGQCLISSTTILLHAIEKVPEEVIRELFIDHLNFLLVLVKLTNNASTVYVRSIAANCLIELELSYPLVMQHHLDVVYRASVEETSPAHQHYMALLATILQHSFTSPSLWKKSSDNHLRSSLVFEKLAPANLELLELIKMVSFLLDQLLLCTCEGTAWITSQVLTMMLHQEELKSSAQVLKLLLFRYVHTYNVAAFHMVLMLESQLDFVLQVRDHGLLLHQLLLNASHPAMMACSKLIFLDFLSDYLNRRPFRTDSLQNAVILLPGNFDGPETQQKKLQLLSSLLWNRECSSTVLVRAVTCLQRQMRCRTSIKLKSALIKSLFGYLCNNSSSDVEDKVSGLLLSSAIEDVTLVPFALNFIHCVQDTFSSSSLPSSVLTSLVVAYTRPDNDTTRSTLHLVLDVLLVAVTQRCSSDRIKTILTYVLKYGMFDEMCEVLSWTLGHQILCICFIVMRDYDASEFFHELCMVFRAFACKCEDVDLQDRAQLYHTLLISLSNKKLKSVLKAPKQVLLSHESTFDSKFSVKWLNKSLLTLSKLSHREGQGLMEMKVPCTDLLLHYEHFLASVSTKSGMIIKVNADFTSEFHEIINIIQAVVIFVSPPKLWGHIDPIMIGHMKRNHGQEACNLDALCFPVNPHPVLAQVSAEFSIDDMCHICLLEPLQIEFSDFFYLLPVPAGQWRQKLFQVLWLSMEDSTASYCSEYVLNCLKHRAYSQIEQKLSTFIVEHNSAVDDLYDIGIHLHPDKHLLMKLKVTDERTVIKLLTDEVYVLAHINDFLKTWE